MRSILLISVCVAGQDLATQSVVLPSLVASVPPTSARNSCYDVFGQAGGVPSSRAQLIYDVADVSVATAVWAGLSLRRPFDGGSSVANPAYTGNATIVMSVSPLAYAATTSTFANNHGANPTTVLAGTINLPFRADPAVWPAPWEAPFLFTTPFTFVGSTGRSLVIDIAQTSLVPPGYWRVEAWYPQNGSRADNWRSLTCRTSSYSYVGLMGTDADAVVGGSWTAAYRGVPYNSVGVGALGALGAGRTWLGARLPVDLAPFGAPGCALAVSMDVLLPLVGGTGGYASWPAVAVPPRPILAGQTFYDQGVFVDTRANRLGLVTSWSSQWTVGTNRGQPGAFVSALGTAASGPVGTRQNEFTVSVRLQ